MKERYFGSVRFFKNLILLAVIVGIAAPSVLAVRYHGALEAAASGMTEPAASGKEPDASAETPPASKASRAASGASSQTEASSSAAGSSPAVLPDGAPAALADYAALYPDFYAETPFVGTEHTDKTIYLTFDDGPSDRTPEILQTLAAQEVKATFFVIGKTDETSLQRMRDVAAAGHTLGMHSYSHDYRKIYASVEAYLADMYDLFCLIRNTTGVTPTVFRLPGGSINSYNYGVYQEILSEMLRRGFGPCDWNLSSGDATGHAITKAQMLDNVVGKAPNVNRGFVLMHDAEDKTTTSAALSDMIAGLRELGFSFAALTPETRPVLFGYLD